MEEDYPSCRAAVREALERRNVPKEALTIMLSSLSYSSLNQYDSCLKKWWLFCRGKIIDPYKCDILQEIRFLSAKFDKGASHGTLNSCRSAIALLSGPELGEDARVRRIFKGIANLRPVKPKYELTWDPRFVLNLVAQ